MKLHFGKSEFSGHIGLILLSVVVGFLAGLASIAFKYMIQYFQELFWATPSIIGSAAAQPWYRTLLLPAAGGLLISPLIYYGAREAKGHGVPEIMESLIFRGGKIPTKVAVVKALASSICISSGGSVGREGPIVQISSTIASAAGRLFHVKERSLRTIVAAGAGAGIGGTFNAPIAGALFAVEILLGDFGVFSFSPIIVASVISTLTTRMLTGNFAAFTVPQYTLTSVWEIGPYILLGLASGAVAILFIKSLYFLEDRFDSFPVHPLLKPILGGLLVGGIGLVFPHVLGLGYESIDFCLQNQIGFLLAFILIFVKICGTSLTLGSGGSGGIFAPSLFLGAMTGNFIGSIFHNAFPSSISSPGAFSLVGMGAVVAGATQAPITAIIIIFELTNDYKIILPLMLSCIIASFMTVGIHKESIYTMKLKRRGILIQDGREVSILRALPVKNFLNQDYLAFTNNESAVKIINEVIGGKHHSFQIIDSDKNYLGCFSLNQLKKYLLDRDVLESVIIAEDLAVPGIQIDYEENLESALKIFGKKDVEELAVVKKGKLIGVIKRKDVIEAYNHEISKREAASGLIQKLKFTPITRTADIGKGYRISEINAPTVFWGKTLKELNLKARHRVDVLVIKRSYPPQTITIPLAEEKIREGDQLVLAGPTEEIERMMKKSNGI
ncbi:MAG: chloride channel protein [Candidatus Aminicenantes bacterium]|nr:chloride channel protein [Candidatus Aminicenantes bacterium]